MKFQIELSSKVKEKFSGQDIVMNLFKEQEEKERLNPEKSSSSG